MSIAVEPARGIAHSAAMRSIVTLAVAVALAGCVGASRPVPAPAPRLVPAAVPPAPAPAPLGGDWRDWPYTPGDWTYRQDGRGSIASYGVAGAAPQFAVRCDPAAATITLSRAVSVAAPAAMTVRTSTARRTIAAQPAGGMLAASVDARDGLLEAIGFSRGRFVVEQPGLPALVLPTWPEIQRVTEDCRR